MILELQHQTDNRCFTGIPTKMPAGKARWHLADKRILYAICPLYLLGREIAQGSGTMWFRGFACTQTWKAFAG